MCGVDMDVPDRTSKGPAPRRVLGGYAARMLSPGAKTSGFSTPGVMVLGPRDDNDATVGDGRTPSTVLCLNLTARVVTEFDGDYLVTLTPSAAVTWTTSEP